MNNKAQSRAPYPGARSRRASLISPWSLVGRMLAAVAAPYALLLPLLQAGWLTGAAFVAAALTLSILAVIAIAIGLNRSLARLRAAVGRSIEKASDRASARQLSLAADRDAALRESLADRALLGQFERAQRIARVGSWEWTRADDRLSCSTEARRILGADAAQLGRPAAILRLVHPDDRRAFRRWMLELARGAARDGLDVRILAEGGELRHVHVLGETLRDATGERAGVAGTLQDATERTRAIQRIHRLAYFDVLTDLPNRSRFHEKMAETLELAKQRATSFAIMFLDLDQFKRINDTLGHSVGDDLLRIIAQRLTRSMRADDMAASMPLAADERDVCRQGGDEFIVLLNGVGNEQDAARAANRLLTTLAQPISLGTQDVFVSASIGIVLYPRDGADLDTLLKNADVAMYHAKAHGRNRFFFYQESMRAASAQRLSLENDLRKALEAEQFELYYQPQIELPSCRIVAIEALIRWNHPTLGLLTPAHFIPVAEEAGLIMDIWEWVLVAALIQHNAWIEQGLPPVTIGVNLSSVQFSDAALAARVREIAQVIDVPLDHLELEVTESMLLADFEAALKTLTELRSLGVKIAIDDFGTGYSSLSYLRRLPLDKLKLDQSFTRDAQHNEGDVAITRAVIAMAQSLKLAVVAEGVETQAQIDLLQSLGCTTVQGFLLGRPLPADATAELLRQSAAAAAPGRPHEADADWGAIVQPRTGGAMRAERVDEPAADGPA
ncbi:MAG TPA: EAL domain-containing protein [Casimicrobiaceae bacterium]|nr:EAL domain-containing protein [Casimicrobiaceae bacterium]